MRTGNEGTFYPEMASLTDGQLTDKQLEEELDKGRVYRLNDRFFNLNSRNMTMNPVGGHEKP